MREHSLPKKYVLGDRDTSNRVRTLFAQARKS